MYNSKAELKLPHSNISIPPSNIGFNIKIMENNRNSDKKTEIGFKIFFFQSEKEVLTKIEKNFSRRKGGQNFHAISRVNVKVLIVFGIKQ